MSRNQIIDSIFVREKLVFQECHLCALCFTLCVLCLTNIVVLQEEKSSYFPIYGLLLREEWAELIDWFTTLLKQSVDDQLIRFMANVVTIARIKNLEHDVGYFLFTVHFGACVEFNCLLSLYYIYSFFRVSKELFGKF